MGIVNLQASLNDSLDLMLGFWNYDAWLVLDGHVPAEKLVNVAQTVPGVEEAEAWGFAIGRYIRPDETESDNLYLMAPPAGTKLLDPPDRRRSRHSNQAIPIPFLSALDCLPTSRRFNLADPITIKIEGREQTYHVAGVMQMMGNSTIGYFTVMDYSALYPPCARTQPRQRHYLHARSPRDLETQRQIASARRKGI